MTYTPNTWVDGVSAANATRLTHMENELSFLDGEVQGTTTGDPSTLLRLDDSGRAMGADGTDGRHFATVAQVEALIAAGGLITKEVTQLTLGSQPSASGTTLADVPDLVKTDAQTGDIYRCDYILKHRGDAGGIQYVFKGNTTAVTNKLGNPSFEVDTSNWTATGLTTLTRDVSLGGQDGSANLKAVISGTQTSQQIWSEWVPVTAGQAVSGGAYARRVSSSARTVRADIQYQDVSGNLLAGTLGTNTTPGTGAWTQAVVDDTHGGPSVAPTGAVAARLRIVILAVAAADEFHFDAAQLEYTGTLPAYGSTGGSGSASLAVDGTWVGLKTTGTTDDDYGRHQNIRTPAVAGVTATFGALATDTDTSGSFLIIVGGTGLTNQIVGLQFAKRTTSGSSAATQLMSGSVTIAKLAVAA